MNTSIQFTSLQVWPSGKSYTYAGHYPNYTIKTGTGETQATDTEAREIRREELARLYQDRDVLACQSSLVDTLLRCSHESTELSDYSWEEVENLYTDPSDWTLKECSDYCDDEGIDTDDLPSLFSLNHWPSLDLIATALQKYQDHYDTYADGSGAITIQFGIDESGKWALCCEADSSVGEDIVCHDYESEWTGNPVKTATIKIAQALLGPLQSEYEEDYDEDDTLGQYQEAIREHCQDNPQEVYEWWLVSDWLYRQLSAIGEPVLSASGGYYWGRTCTGQSMLMDGTLQQVADQFVE